MAITPMMRQYFEIKEQHRDSILFYRLGDFYEMFYDDAKLASRELELTLTGRDCGDGQRAPMCGVPYHSADGYIGRLVSRGYKVVICEQTEDPATAKGLVRREVIRIVTPGTQIDSAQLDEGRNNFLCAVCLSDGRAGVAFADISTGELSSTEFDEKYYVRRLIDELASYSPSEIIINADSGTEPELDSYLAERTNAVVRYGQAERYDYAEATRLCLRSFSAAGFDSAATPESAVRAMGALLGYVTETQMSELKNLTKLNVYSEGQYLELDASTRRNLELCESMRSKEKRGTLLWVLDSTRTSMGARMLRRWIEMPLLNAYKIGRRQRAVAELTESFMIREELAELLSGIYDLDRLVTKVVYGTAGARDLRSISQTAAQIPHIKELLAEFHCEELADLYLMTDPLTDIRELIDRSIVDEPPFSLREGGYIRRGYSAEADELYDIVHNGKSYIEQLAVKEREATGIKNLKISFNRVFGYYIEVTKTFISQVPDRYIRKQTLANSERYITEELKEKEAIILGASDRLSALEYELFGVIREQIAAQVRRIQDTGQRLASLDAYLSLANAAVKNGYCCPEIEYGSVIKIKEGRHPVVEQFTGDAGFVPNDTLLDTNHNRLALITGPNMAGKSTYMRQVALITLMAQIGSFVPAAEARIGVVDKIFTRVGASDDLASGQSTFMLEMTEVAYILRSATRRSLIVYDEIGRGTSTYDGMSIARAVAEYTASKKLGAKTLFATHYHELTELEGRTEGVVNYNIAAKKKGEDIIFLRKILRGGTDDSYGIEVARLAGVPSDITRRAKEILRRLNEAADKPAPTERQENVNITFDDFKADEVRSRLLNTDVNLLTPIEALNFVCELKKLAK